MPAFNLETVDGESLGAIELGRPDWSMTWRRDKANLRVVGRLEAGDKERPAEVLVVAEV